MRNRKTSEVLMRILQDDYTANNFGQQESRDGYSAQGEYFVNLPDGRLQKVKFCLGNIFPTWKLFCQPAWRKTAKEDILPSIGIIFSTCKLFCQPAKGDILHLWKFSRGHLRYLQVTYTVNGDGGYVADVSYTGEAQVKFSTTKNWGPGKIFNKQNWGPGETKPQFWFQHWTSKLRPICRYCKPKPLI